MGFRSPGIVDVYVNGRTNYDQFCEETFDVISGLSMCAELSIYPSSVKLYGG